MIVVAALAAIGGLRLGSGPAVSAPAAWRFAVGVVAFPCSSVLQDVLLLSGMMVCLEARLSRPAVIGIPALIFAALHLRMPNATVFVFLTDAAFAVALAALFVGARARRSLAAPVGLHTAWNVGIAIVLGLPLAGEASSWALVRHEGGVRLWIRGDYGPEGGLSGLLACLLLVGIGLALRSRRVVERAVAGATNFSSSPSAGV